jgi:hypothetical protein
MRHKKSEIAPLIENILILKQEKRFANTWEATVLVCGINQNVPVKQDRTRQRSWNMVFKVSRQAEDGWWGFFARTICVTGGRGASPRIRVSDPRWYEAVAFKSQDTKCLVWNQSLTLSYQPITDGTFCVGMNTPCNRQHLLCTIHFLTLCQIKYVTHWNV